MLSKLPYLPNIYLHTMVRPFCSLEMLDALKFLAKLVQGIKYREIIRTFNENKERTISSEHSCWCFQLICTWCDMV